MTARVWWLRLIQGWRVLQAVGAGSALYAEVVTGAVGFHWSQFKVLAPGFGEEKPAHRAG